MRFTSAFRTMTVFVAALLLAAACTPEEPTRAVVIGVDQSASVKPEQRARYRSKAEAKVKALKPGDSLLILAIHSNTRDADPLFKDALPDPIPEGSPTKVQIDFRSRVAKFHAAAQQALSAAFDSPGRAQSTDLFSVFDRVKSDTNRETEVFLMSDGLNSTPEFDMEHLRLEEAKVAEVVQKLIRGRRWTNTTLQNTTVRIVVPALNDGDRAATVNDRLAVRRFYEVLCAAIGGQLINFSVEGD